MSRAALAEMRKIAAKRPLPDLFLFTDDYLKTGAHPPELDLGSVYKPGATF